MTFHKIRLTFVLFQESLCQLITKRIGVETFVDKLAEIAKHEIYSKALKHPQIRINTAADIQFDHEFCRMYKGIVVSNLESAD